MSEMEESMAVSDGNGRGKSMARRLLPLLVLAAAIFLAFASGLHEHLSIEALREHRSALNGFVAEMGMIAALAFIALYAVTTLLILPVGAVLTIAGGFLFGVTLGTLYVVIGATLGAAALFLVARSTFGDHFRAKAGPFMQRMEAGFRENAFSYMLVLRLIPLFPFFVVNVVPAFLGVPLRTYVLGTLLGIIPGTLVFILAGAGLGSVFDRGGAFTAASILTPEIIARVVDKFIMQLEVQLSDRGFFFFKQKTAYEI